MFLLTVAKADDDDEDDSNTGEIVAWIVCSAIAGIVLTLCCAYCICVTFYAKPTINSKSSTKEDKGFIQELSLSQYHRNVDESSTTQQNLKDKSMDITLPGTSQGLGFTNTAPMKQHTSVSGSTGHGSGN